MKVASIVGTRPEIIRMSEIIQKLDQSCAQVLINTRQNFDLNMNDIFFKELGIRQPDYEFDNHSQTFLWLGNAMKELANVLEKEQPDKVLFLGDTYSSLASAYTAARLGIPIYHMEAGNRSHDTRMPEELNRRTIDHLSNIHLPYTHNSKNNLIKEGIEQRYIFVCGNPIVEVLDKHEPKPGILAEKKLRPREYFVLTTHRKENVEDNLALLNIIEGCNLVHAKYGYPVIFSCHPNTRSKLAKIGTHNNGIKYHEPFGFNDFIELERNALCVITDSGTCQEEACILNVPCVTIRDSTERPETLECGANILAGVNAGSIVSCVERALSNTGWSLPLDYRIQNTSDIVANLICGVS